MDSMDMDNDFPPLPPPSASDSTSSIVECPGIVLEDGWREPGDKLDDFYAKMWRMQMNGDIENPRFYFDAKFWVGEGDDKVVVRAHRFFLSLHSEVFRDILDKVEEYFKGNRGASEMQELLTFPNVDPDAFIEALNYLYIGSFSENISMPLMIRILEVAEKFDLKKLLHDGKESLKHLLNEGLALLANLHRNA